MDVFKLRVSDIHGIMISRENFEHEKLHLAVCPVCDNTITIVGLHSSDTEVNKENGEVQTSHGRHYLYKQLDSLGILP